MGRKVRLIQNLPTVTGRRREPDRRPLRRRAVGGGVAARSARHPPDFVSHHPEAPSRRGRVKNASCLKASIQVRVGKTSLLQFLGQIFLMAIM